MIYLQAIVKNRHLENVMNFRSLFQKEKTVNKPF